MGDGVKIYNISNPLSPSLVNTVDTNTDAGGNWQSLAMGINVEGNYLYVANFKNGENFLVYDATDLNNITKLDGIHIGDEARKVDVSGNYAYVANRHNGLKIIDISDKSNISVSTTYDPGEVRGVSVNGNYAYLACGNDGLKILDVTTPSSPNLIGSYNTDGYSEDITYDNEKVYISDSSNGMVIIDVSNANSPSLLGTYDSPDSAQSTFVSDGTAYVGDFNGGLQIVSVPVTINSDTTLVSDKTYEDLTIESGTILTIDSNASLNISGTLTNNGSIVMNSSSNEYSSLIAGSKAGSGTYTYNKFISTVATNDLISAPFNGQAFNDFYATLSPYTIFRNPGGSQNAVLFGRFNNDTGVYTNNHVSGDNISTGIINAGEGFRVGSGIYKEDFSSSLFYNDTDGTYLLKNKSGKWGAAVDWEIDNTAETTYVSANLKKAVMKHGFSGLSQGDKITIRLELSIEGSDDASGSYSIARFGFSTSNTTGWANTNSNFIF